MDQNAATESDEQGPLSFWDAVSLIIGIVIGSSIYKTPGLIFSNVSSPWIGLGLWVLCGLLSFASALCYAELATTYPRSGGEYNYLTRAYGRWAGFQFGWCQLAIIQTGSIGALSYVFAEYAVDLLQVSPDATVWFALGAVTGLTLLNIVGINAGRHTQKVLVLIKLAGLLFLIFGGLAPHSNATMEVSRPVQGEGGLPLALILTLYAYGGWNDAAFVTAEVRNRTRNIPRALMLGIGIIVVVYLLVNLAYLKALGFEGLRDSMRPPADALTAVLGKSAGRAMSLLVAVSALGGVNGLILAVSRVHATVGADHVLFERLGRWSKLTRTPVWSLLVQGIVTALMIIVIGTESGRKFTDEVLQQIHLSPIPWGKYFGGFNTLFAASAPIFWLFFLITGLAYFVLRFKDKNRARPFVAPWFPICPIMLCSMSAFGLYSAAIYAAPLLPLIAVPFFLGLPLYGISQLLRKKRAEQVEPMV